MTSNDTYKDLIQEVQNISLKIAETRQNLDDNSKNSLKSAIFRIISYKYFWYSKECYKFSNLLISDLVITLTLLCGHDKRIFYTYLRSSIEAFYNSATMSKDENIENDASSYFKVKKKFKRLISTQKKFKFDNSFNELNDYYGKISNIIHRNVFTSEPLIIYMNEYLSTDDFNNPHELCEAIKLLDSITNIYTSFFLYSPSFKNILNDSFYRKKELLKLIQEPNHFE